MQTISSQNHISWQSWVLIKRANSEGCAQIFALSLPSYWINGWSGENIDFPLPWPRFSWKGSDEQRYVLTPTWLRRHPLYSLNYIVVRKTLSIGLSHQIGKTFWSKSDIMMHARVQRIHAKRPTDWLGKPISLVTKVPKAALFGRQIRIIWGSWKQSYLKGII